MKTNKKTLMAVKQFLENREREREREGWSLDELISEIVAETDLLKIGDITLSIDECSIEWGEREICILSNFIDKYSEVFIEKICNTLDSFIDEDLSYFDI